jgi:acetolactate synthase-1/2/3 large subunit
MTPLHGGDRIAEVLRAHGVPFLFTLCGGHISPILTAARERGIRVVDLRDEATAVFAADATARLTGIPGVAAVTAGPGLTNGLTALRNAQLAQSPLVLLGGAAPTALRKRGALQDIDQMATVRPHVKRAFAITRVRDLAPVVNRALGLARSGVPGPVFVECPVDLLYPEAIVREWYSAAAGKSRSLTGRALQLYLKRHVDRMFQESESQPPYTAAPVIMEPAEAAVRKASQLLTRARRPLLLVGSQTMALAHEATRIAMAVDALGIPVYLSGMARGLLGREHPSQFRHQRRVALRNADCVILAGAPADFRLDYGHHLNNAARLIAANRSRREARLNRRPTLLVEGDAGLFLSQLATLFQPDRDRLAPWFAQLKEWEAAREAEIDGQAQTQGEFVNPLRLCREIDAAMAEDAVLVADGGDFVATASYTVSPRGPLGWLDPGVFGTLGVGAGFAAGARLCRPASEIWLLLGDGAAGWSLAEFDSFTRHQLPVIAVVGNDAGWTQIAREQVKLLQDDVGTVLARSDYHLVAQGFGAEGILVQHNSEIRPALERARAAARNGKPVLVNVWLDRTDFREGSISM